ncbi:MAG: CARDB domain-containing protein [Nanoarchaeota archaeon]
MSINDLIDSFNYSYYNGSISIISSNDYMFDGNSNGLNDTLVINLTSSGSGSFNFIVKLVDSNNFYINVTTKTFSSSDSIQTNFPTELLLGNFFNYTVEITDLNNELVYRQYKTQTNKYKGYENGSSVIQMSDANIDNNWLRVGPYLNYTKTATVNVTITLRYNSSTISRTEEKLLGPGLNIFGLDFDNETIKSTHHHGNFTIETMVVGDKIFYINKNTSIYNYEDFAKTTYIKSITDTRIDTNNNNLSEFLEINFTVNSFSTETYNLTYDLYDEFDNFVISINKTQALSIGDNTVQTLINGSEIYKTKINGPYLVSFAKLAVGAETEDILFNAYTTSQNAYTDYERPPLPDLHLNISINFDDTTNTTNITINLSNIGQAPAFNIFLDIFDNATYNNNGSSSFISNGESIIYEFNITNSSNASLITAIADFDNLVDESNESNNIAQNTKEQIVSLNIESISTIYANSTLRIFEFSILNDGDTTVSNIQWQFNTGDNYIINSTSNISLLNAGEKAFVYVQYSYSGDGSYSINASATGINQGNQILSSMLENLEIGNLLITSFDAVNVDASKAIFEIHAKDIADEAISGINWSIDTNKDSILLSNQQFDLQSGETIFIFVQHDYASGGTYNPIAVVASSTHSSIKAASVTLHYININNIAVLNESGNKRIFGFDIENGLSTNLTNVNWTLDTRNSNVINATSNIILQPNEKIFVYIDYNYTSAGIYNINTTARNGTLIDSRNLTIII